MKSLSMQKRLAADLLKVGESRVLLDDSKLTELGEAITREDIKGLIVKGYIRVKPKIGVSRGRAKKVHEQKKKGRQKGPGSRKGAKKARTPKKRAWINKIRPQRKLLQSLKTGETVDNKQFRKLYNLAKGGFFRSRRHLKLYVSKLIGLKKKGDDK
ncbi:MAG: 50S ribosomal protein L19e [Candidatus Nanoarchaeia archaeon]|jgi:large subunit ribosomal protein L19e